MRIGEKVNTSFGVQTVPMDCCIKWHVRVGFTCGAKPESASLPHPVLLVARYL